MSDGIDGDRRSWTCECGYQNKGDFSDLPDISRDRYTDLFETAICLKVLGYCQKKSIDPFEPVFCLLVGHHKREFVGQWGCEFCTVYNSQVKTKCRVCFKSRKIAHNIEDSFQQDKRVLRKRSRDISDYDDHDGCTVHNNSFLQLPRQHVIAKEMSPELLDGIINQSSSNGTIGDGTSSIHEPVRGTNAAYTLAGLKKPPSPILSEKEQVIVEQQDNFYYVIKSLFYHQHSKYIRFQQLLKGDLETTIEGVDNAPGTTIEVLENGTGTTREGTDSTAGSFTSARELLGEATEIFDILRRSHASSGGMALLPEMTKLWHCVRDNHALMQDPNLKLLNTGCAQKIDSNEAKAQMLQIRSNLTEIYDHYWSLPWGYTPIPKYQPIWHDWY